MSLRYLQFFIFFLLSSGIFAQNVIRGKILDEYTGEPLIGANILIKGTTDGNTTDFDGYFEIKTQQEYPMVAIVSYLGYDEKEVQLISDIGKIEIKLQESSIAVDVVDGSTTSSTLLSSVSHS